jgi:hypothetical protein
MPAYFKAGRRREGFDADEAASVAKTALKPGAARPRMPGI